MIPELCQTLARQHETISQLTEAAAAQDRRLAETAEANAREQRTIVRLQRDRVEGGPLTVGEAFAGGTDAAIMDRRRRGGQGRESADERGSLRFVRCASM